jgi:hypothetical protein
MRVRATAGWAAAAGEAAYGIDSGAIVLGLVMGSCREASSTKDNPAAGDYSAGYTGAVR